MTNPPHSFHPNQQQTELLEARLQEMHDNADRAPSEEAFVSEAHHPVTAQESHPLSCQLDRYLSNLFLQIGIPANKLGFRFLRESVRLVLLDPSLQHRLMHGLYPLVAERFNTTVYCVEHSMRVAITAAWARGRTELIEKQLGRGVITAYEKPTNGELIALISENIRLLIREGKL